MCISQTASWSVFYKEGIYVDHDDGHHYHHHLKNHHESIKLRCLGQNRIDHLGHVCSLTTRDVKRTPTVRSLSVTTPGLTGRLLYRVKFSYN